MKPIFRYFLQGLIYVAPLAITVYVVYIVFSFVDGFLQQYIQGWFDIHIPGLGVVVIFLLISLLGFIG